MASITIDKENGASFLAHWSYMDSLIELVHNIDEEEGQILNDNIGGILEQDDAEIIHSLLVANRSRIGSRLAPLDSPNYDSLGREHDTPIFGYQLDGGPLGPIEKELLDDFITFLGS